ncbi:MAG: hypothetical protein R3C29_17705 [Dehalococcoidia bacterium]
MPLPVKRRRLRVFTAETAMLPVFAAALRVGGVLAGLLAGASAVGLLFAPELASELLAAAGGLGALGFGAAQVHGQLSGRLASIRRARVAARLARRMLVERVNSVGGRLLREWVARIGTAASLDPVEQAAREFLDLAAPLGGPLADAAETALQSFHLGADHINGLFLHIEEIKEFGPKDIASKGRALAHWVRAIDILDAAVPPADADIAVSPTARRYGAFTEEQLAGLADRRATA